MKTKINYIFLLLFLLVSMYLGKFIAAEPLGFPLYFLVGLFVVIVSLIDIRVALGFLIMSMLLSPEITLAPFNPQRSVVVRFDDLILILIFFVWITKTAINKKLPLIRTTPINKYIYFYVGACFLFTIKGIFMGDVQFKSAIFYLLKYTEYFIIFWMTYNIIEKKKDIKILMTFATVTAIAVIIYGYTRIYTRVTAPFDTEPGSIGGYFILVLAVSLGTFLYHPSKAIKYLSLFIFLAVMPLFIKTQSRASYLAFFPMYFAMIYFTEKYKKTLIIIGLSLILFLLLIFNTDIGMRDEGLRRTPLTFVNNLMGIFKKRVKYTFSGTYGRYKLESSSAARIKSWKHRLFKLWPQKPITGWGITGIKFIDSQYIRTLVELGVIGMAVFMLMLYKIYTELKSVFRQIKFDWGKGIVIGLMSAYIGFLLHAVPTNTFIIVRIMEPFWLLLAVAMALPKLEEQNKIG